MDQEISFWDKKVAALEEEHADEIEEMGRADWWMARRERKEAEAYQNDNLG